MRFNICVYTYWAVCVWTLKCYASVSVWDHILEPFQSVSPADTQYDRRTDLWGGGQTDAGQRLKPSQLKQSGGFAPDCLWDCVACRRQNRRLNRIRRLVHLTSVTFGCSTKDSGLILGMSIWIWQQHGRESVRYTHAHIYIRKYGWSPIHALNILHVYWPWEHFLTEESLVWAISTRIYFPIVFTDCSLTYTSAVASNAIWILIAFQKANPGFITRSSRME